MTRSQQRGLLILLFVFVTYVIFSIRG